MIGAFTDTVAVDAASGTSGVRLFKLVLVVPYSNAKDAAAPLLFRMPCSVAQVAVIEVAGEASADGDPMITYAVDATGLFENPGAMAIALIVKFDETRMGAVYRFEVLVGCVPLVV